MQEKNPDFIPLLTPQFPKWPAPIEYLDFKATELTPPVRLIANMLNSKCRMIFGGGSKTFKTWAMCDMTLSSVAGATWWGFSTSQAKMIYVNFELTDYEMQQRLCAIEKAKGLKIDKDQLYIWNLKNQEITLPFFKQELLKLIEDHSALGVCIDPFYKLLDGADERLSASINPILAAFDEINRLTPATVIFAAHFTKGNQAGKESIDRISGGGSINRDPDTLLTLTKHEVEYAFTVDFTLRSFAPICPFVVRWEYPLLIRTELDPEQIKRPAPRGGRPAYDPKALLALIKDNDDELTTEELITKAGEMFGWSRRTVFNKLETLKNSKHIFFSMASGRWNASIR